MARILIVRCAITPVRQSSTSNLQPGQRIWLIQATGTRFVRSFFNYQGFSPQVSHAGHSVPDVALIIPKRDPILCYESHASRENFDLAMFIGCWHELIHRAKTGFLFPIEEKDEDLERAVCKFVGINYIPGFPWVRVGESNRDRTLAYTDVSKELQFAVDWFNG